MIPRSLLLIDRLATLLVALALIAAGALGVWWWTETGPLPRTVNARPALDWVGRDWFPWATGLAGIVLVLLAFRWLAAHVHRAGVSELNLTGSSSHGALIAAAPKVVGAAADAYADTLGVRSARGSLTRDRGQLVARIQAVIDDDTDLTELARHADEVAAQLRQVLGRGDIVCRFELKTAGVTARIPGIS